KPANLSMHPGAGNPDRSVLNALIGHFKPGSAGFSDPARLGLVHRLDKDTTGVVVVAKTPAAMAMLSAQFSERSVKKVYQALAFVTPRGRRLVQLSAKGRIDAPLGRHPKRRTSMAVVAEGGRSAISDWECLELMPYAALLEVKLLTGRTHQIRVHLQHIGSPIIGDALYGEFSGLPKPLLEAAKAFGRQALHACCLEFNHPLTKERLMFESPLPMDFQELIKVFRGSDMHPFT
ncbi:MAG: RluA family pseudouridine synthase, partial [Deltaproteobacteria bacterium]|nr:RluA family pseudouridine synthase [Deltaproteobacteria bacterium]